MLAKQQACVVTYLRRRSGDDGAGEVALSCHDTHGQDLQVKKGLRDRQETAATISQSRSYKQVASKNINTTIVSFQ